MGHSASRRNLWLQIIAVLLLLGGLLVWLVRAETKPLNRDELKIEVSNLRSYAAEGRLLAEPSLSGKATRAYFQTQTDLLEDKAEDALKGLDAAKVEEGLELKHWEARSLARQVKTSLERLYSSFERPQEMESVKGELEKLLSRLKELEESLK